VRPAPGDEQRGQVGRRAGDLSGGPDVLAGQPEGGAVHGIAEAAGVADGGEDFTTVSNVASAWPKRSMPAVSGSSASVSLPSQSTVPLRAARSCIAVMPGIVATSSPGTRSRTVAAR